MNRNWQSGPSWYATTILLAALCAGGRPGSAEGDGSDTPRARHAPSAAPSGNSTSLARQVSAETAGTATVEGLVVYDEDLSRPWRYARYYIKNRKQGSLAEAVVCLTPARRSRAEGASAPRAQPDTVVIDQKDFRFIPETIAIRAGDRVRFTNQDPQVHNVRTFDGGQPFNVNTLSGGQYVHTFDEAGGIRRPIRIGCSYHSTMKAWVFIFDHPYFQVTQADGKFRLSNVPAGEYRLEMFHPAGSLAWSKRIMVAAGTDEKLTIRVSPDNLTEERP